MIADEITRALRHLRRLSRSGVVRTDSDPDDRPLLAACADPAAVSARINAVATDLGTTEPRVAASSLQYELAERLWTVTIGVWSQTGFFLDVSQFHVGPDPAVWRLATPAPKTCRDPHPVLDCLEVLHRTLRTHTPVADGLLWGNAATAATLALGPVSGTTAHARASALVNELLDQAPLRDRLRTANGVVVRRSCCLYYRTRHARTCGDCPIPAPTAVKAIARLRKPR